MKILQNKINPEDLFKQERMIYNFITFILLPLQ